MFKELKVELAILAKRSKVRPKCGSFYRINAITIGLKTIMDRQYRSDPRYAEEIISTLWPNKRLRRECLQFLLDSIRFSHCQGPAAWEVTLFEEYAV